MEKLHQGWRITGQFSFNAGEVYMEHPWFERIVITTLKKN